jgi:hypothetical protein
LNKDIKKRNQEGGEESKRRGERMEEREYEKGKNKGVT